MSAGYVIITAARNEASYIGHTLRAVTGQTIPPASWIIVSDGSTDGTDAVVKLYAERYPYIHLVNSAPDGARSFGSKARAINQGYGLARDVPHDFVAVLDADVSFEPDYYAAVIERFDLYPSLGLAGGILYDNINGKFVRQTCSLGWSVSGPIQMFRRACFEAIGGYQPLPRGGIDAVAETSVRMNGWSVRTFPEIQVLHHRRTGAEKGNPLVTCYRDGLKEYGYGSYPLFEAAKAFSRLLHSPPFLGSVLRLSGYGSAWLRREPRNLPPNVLDAVRREQRARLLGRFHFKGMKGAPCP